MAVSFTWLGHSTFWINVDGRSILIDPFLTGNPLAAAAPEELNPDLILLSHGHGDHTSDVVSIAKRTGAPVVANFEIANWLEKQGVQEVAGKSRW